MKSFITGSILSVLAIFSFSDRENPKEDTKIEVVKAQSTTELLEKTTLYTQVENINKYADSIDVEIKKHKSEKNY